MKSYFILHNDSLSIVDKLSDEQNGKLLKMMRSYHNGESYEPNDFVVEIAFEQFKNQFDRDSEKYESICERNALNGAKGGRPRIETQNNPNNPSGYSETQKNPEEPKKANKNNNNNKEEKEIISSDLFEQFWMQFPHARKGKKQEAMKQYSALVEQEVRRELDLLKLRIDIGEVDPKYLSACERRLRDFTPISKTIRTKSISLYRKLHKEDPKKEELYKRWIDNYPEQRKAGSEEFRKSQGINLSSFK